MNRQVVEAFEYNDRFELRRARYEVLTATRSFEPGEVISLADVLEWVDIRFDNEGDDTTTLEVSHPEECDEINKSQG